MSSLNTVVTGVSAVLLRVALSFGVESLDRPGEITTTLTSNERLKEGTFLLDNGIDPYAGDFFHQSPLLLIISSAIPAIFHPLFFVLVDLFTACLLYRLVRHVNKSPLPKSFNLSVSNPLIVSIIYLLHPFVILSSSSLSSVSINNAILVLCLCTATFGDMSQLAGVLSLAVNLDLYPILLLPLCFMINRQCKGKELSKSSATFFILLFVFHQTLLLYLEYCFLGSWNFLRSFKNIITVNDLTPNVGLSWYFFIEIFDHFRPFFVGVFHLHIFIYIIPLCIKLKHDPLFAAILLIGIIATFKSYPTIGDAALFHTLLFVYPFVFKQMRQLFISISLIIYATSLLPTFHYLWIYAASGNANFFYASTLVWALGHVLLVIDFMFAYLKVSFAVDMAENESNPLSDKDSFIVQK